MKIIMLMMMMLMMVAMIMVMIIRNGLVQFHKLFSSKTLIVSLKVLGKPKVYLYCYSSDLSNSGALALFLSKCFAIIEPGVLPNIPVLGSILDVILNFSKCSMTNKSVKLGFLNDKDLSTRI